MRILDLHAYVAPGTTVPANASVGALSTTDKVGSRVTTLNRPQDPFDAMERKRLLNRRTFIGIPIAYMLQALPYVPFVYFLEWWFYFLLQERRGHLQWPKASWLFWFAYPWVWRIGFHEFYFWTVVIYKWVFIGRFSEKRDEKPLRRMAARTVGRSGGLRALFEALGLDRVVVLALPVPWL